MLIALAILVGFAAGSIPFGPLFARMRGIDLKKIGSGNVGATNAARALGRKTGILVLLCDAAKGALPVLLALKLWPHPGERALIGAALGGGAVLGHVFSPWLRFRGGKGIATGLGVFVTLAPVAAVALLGVWLAAYLVTRISSVGSLLSVTALPLLLYLLHAETPIFLLAVALWPLVLWTHRDNIRRLLGRSEHKV